jgi:hypothetical protein
MNFCVDTTIKTDIQSYFVEKCFKLICEKKQENKNINIEMLIEDIKLDDTEIYELLDECADETDEHISYIIFDMFDDYERFGVEPNKEMNQFINDYIELTCWENLSLFKDKYEDEIVESGNSESESDSENDVIICEDD